MDNPVRTKTGRVTHKLPREPMQGPTPPRVKSPKLATELTSQYRLLQESWSSITSGDRKVSRPATAAFWRGLDRLLGASMKSETPELRVALGEVRSLYREHLQYRDTGDEGLRREFLFGNSRSPGIYKLLGDVFVAAGMGPIRELRDAHPN